jgi:hypothetical protein
VLQQKSAVPKLSLSLECEMHGVAISTKRVDVSSEPPSIQVKVNDKPARKATLARKDLERLWTAMSAPGLAAFVAESPKSGPRAPGYRRCTLTMQAQKLDVKKSWDSSQTFTSSSSAARSVLMKELSALEKRLP